MNIGLEHLLTQIGNTINLIGVIFCFWLGSKIYKNVVIAHKKNIYNTVNYDNCDIYTQKKDEWR